MSEMDHSSVNPALMDSKEMEDRALILMSAPWQTHVTTPMNASTSLLGTVVEGVQTGTAVMLLQVWA